MPASYVLSYMKDVPKGSVLKGTLGPHFDYTCDWDFSSVHSQFMQTLTTGLHPGKGLSLLDPVAPGLEGDRGQNVILALSKNLSYQHYHSEPLCDDTVTRQVAPAALVLVCSPSPEAHALWT